MLNYSFIVPVQNEEENVANLYNEIIAAGNKLHGSFEVIFINDGSTDSTLQKLKQLKPIRIISFRRNYGQSSALDAGIQAARGEIIITMDGDGQNDPADSVAMVAKLQEGYDVVCGWRKKRKDSFSKRFISKGAAFLRSMLVRDTVHDAGCTLRAFRKECFDDIILYGEMHRMIPALLRWQGYTIAEIQVNHRQRLFGTTKYNWKRTVKGFIDMLNIWFWRKYETRPLYFFGTLGLALCVLGLFSWIYVIIEGLSNTTTSTHSMWPLMAMYLSLFGIQLFVFGLIANVMIKNRYEMTGKRAYRIKDSIEIQ